ncbi:quinon protein alcohol dehydrogenase-like superfamily [Lyophyllum atratum]|nr:quinon protein alcohol dehydrogenase-like superfamily [Lyophyllum atratum]
MPHYPHTQLLPGPASTTVISGPHIQVLDSSTGAIRHAATDAAGPVRCAAIDAQGKHLATAGDDKMLKIWEIEGLTLVNERELPKRPTAIRFTADGQTVLASDKFGDVFSYPFHYVPLTVKQKKDALSSHENPSGGQLILGHASLLNAFLLTADEKFIITADRDEHIRVSWYPQGYNIEMYCLGHTKFVSAIHNPAFAPSDLVSGGGDPALKIWDWMTGVVKHEVSVGDTVEPYIRVRTPKRRRGEDGEDGPETRRKGRGKKAKGKGKAKAESEVAEAEIAEVAEDASGATGVEETPLPGAEDNAEKVLVIRKIDSVSSRHLVFSAVGATALFTTPYPSGDVVSGVRVFDVGSPVLDFFVAEDDLIWVSLDGNWDEATSEKTERPFVRVLDLSSGEVSIP